MATLQALLASPDQSVRFKAALAAGTYPELRFIEILISQCAHEPDFFVRDTLSWALMRNDITKVVERLTLELQSKNRHRPHFLGSRGSTRCLQRLGEL